ncbi:MAG: hypothetical protein LBE48_05280 [Methanomassiliicoccaceae archaeon]|jgi:hypothetical protein|nr:hypothetical protein [Methanomassiliicoccaceae archaeon]
MVKKGKFRGARHAPKRLEGEFMAMAKTLSDDPGLLRPKCAGKCRKCHWDGTFDDIEKLDRYKGNADALNKMSQKGSDDIVKAYAGTISIYAAGTVPCLASAKLAGEDVPFIMRGSVGNDKMIGLQYYDDPQKRLLLYNKFAKKKNLYLYSLNDELVCSDKPNMPKDYLLDMFFETPYEFERDLECGCSSDGALVIKVRSLNESVRVCSDCAKDVSTLMYIISRMIAPSPLDDIDVTVEHKYHESKDGGVDKITGDILTQYSIGRLTDRGIVDMILRGKKKDLTSSGVSAYMIDNKHYGSDLDAFIAALKGTEKEKEVLRTYLTKNKKAVILKTDRISEAFASHWKDSAREILLIASSEAVVDKMGDISKLVPIQAIEDAVNGQMALTVAARTPEIKGLGPIGKLADKFARTMKAGGAALLRKEIESAALKDARAKAIARAFIVSAGINEKFTWKWDSEEESLAHFLRPFVDQVISAEGAEYRTAMELLLTASGCGERL